MSRLSIEIAAALFACVASLIMGYFCWRSNRARATYPGAGVISLSDRRRSALLGFLPFWVGCVVGMAILAAAHQTVFAGDRFHEVGTAVLVGIAPLLAGLLYLLVDVLVPPALARAAADETRSTSTRRRSLAMLGAQLLAAVIVVVLGVRFPIMSVGPDVTLELGNWALPATVIWLVVATLFVKLLDGLDGAALLLLLFAAVAICITTANTTEHFLNAYSAVICGAVVGSLRFHLYPARLSQAGGATAFVGFMFAVLTVLARQKTVAAVLLVLPLVIVVLLVGGLILTTLERNLLLKKNDD